MDIKKENNGLMYKTIGGASPQNKSKVYFCSHPDDFSLYFKEISDELFHYHPECALFYYENGNQADFSLEHQETLAEMQLFIIPVTKAFLTEDNIALNYEFPFAIEHKIPILPIMQDVGLETIFNEKCGDLQFLNKCCNDVTEIPYDEKLKNFLNSVLVNDETAQKIRDAFDAYIFLSYRKKDRKHAQELMRLIHENDEFQDVAIWYDEFLVPGENFNNAIMYALQKCNVFTLLVTPNLINEPNYVQKNEFPEAVQYNKPILPVEVIKTNHKELRKQYPNIPACVNARKLSKKMIELLSSIALKENNNDPNHLFFMGLAYLYGIDVEKNAERARNLLIRSSEFGLPESCKKLADMYKLGDGVTRNYETSMYWRKKQVNLLRSIWQENFKYEDGVNYNYALYYLGEEQESLLQIQDAKKTYEALLMLNKHRILSDLNNVDFILMLLISYNKLGDMCNLLKENDDAIYYYEKGAKICNKLLNKTNNIKFRESLGIFYERIGDLKQETGKTKESLDWFAKSLEISQCIAAENKSPQSRFNLHCSYLRMGDNYLDEGLLDEAEKWYKKNLNLSLEMFEETDTVETQRILSIAYDNMGKLAENKESYIEAEKWYEKSLKLCRQFTEKTNLLSHYLDLGISYRNLARIDLKLDKLDDAEFCYKKSLDIYIMIVDQAYSPEYLFDISYTYGKLGDIEYIRDNFKEAEYWYYKDVKTSERLAEETKSDEDLRSLIVSYKNMADICEQLGKHSEHDDWKAKADNIYNTLK